MAVLPSPNEKFCKKAKTILTNILWEGRKAKVKYEQLSYQNGGLKLIDLYYKDLSVKASWIKRLQGAGNSVCVEAYQKYVKYSENIWNCNFDKFIVRYITKNAFWKDILGSSAVFQSLSPSTSTDILNHILWFNNKIKVNTQPIYYAEWAAGILTLRDLLEKNSANFLSYQSFCHKYNIIPSFPKYHALVNAIPCGNKSYATLALQSRKPLVGNQ